MPVSFLRSSDSPGIGDFAAFRAYIELAARRGETIVQILPLVDSGPDHLWPYSSVSSFALNPVYICIQWLMDAFKSSLSKSAFSDIQPHLDVLIKSEKFELVDYSEVRVQKMAILRRVFQEVKPDVVADLVAFSGEFDWVPGYVMYCVIARLEGTFDWRAWPSDLAQAEKKTMQNIAEAYSEDLFFHIFCQWIAFNQVENVHAFAKELGVLIKGDIPILVDATSCDVWACPHYFLTEYGAGAPPDMFTTGGQEWGSPPLNVQNPQAIDYFISRFAFAQNYMDMVRVDHILGLFRLMIWNPRAGTIANEGFFYPQRLGATILSLTRQELRNIDIHPDRYIYQEGIVTDIPNLDNTAEKLIGIGFAKKIKDQDKVAWISDERLKDVFEIEPVDLNKYDSNLDVNEDYIHAVCCEAGWAEDEIKPVLRERRRLQNMLGCYLGKKDLFFFTFYGKETWQYLNLDSYQKEALDTLLAIKLVQKREMWRDHGTDILTKLAKQTSLVLCGEDLGLVDPYIPDVLKELGILGLSVIRWEPQFQPEAQRMLAVLTTSTHDTSTLRQWWEDSSTEPEIKAQFWEIFAGYTDKEVPPHLSDVDLQSILLKLYETSSLVAIIPFWEILEAFYKEPEKRINIPGMGGKVNWLSRMENPLDVYLTAKYEKINDRFRHAISKSGRLEPVSVGNV